MLIGRRVEVRGRGHRRRIVIAYCHPWYGSRGNGYGTLHRDEKIACEKIRVEVAERRRKRKTLQLRPLQDSHMAHRSPGLPAIAVLPGRTAHKLPVKVSALIAKLIVAHIVQEAKRSPSHAGLAGSLYSRDETTIR